MTTGPNQPPPPPDERRPGDGGSGWDAPPPPPPPPPTGQGGPGWTGEPPGPGAGWSGQGQGQGRPGWTGPGWRGGQGGGQGGGMDSRAASGLCYVLTIITGVIFLIVDRRPEVRFHAMQAILFGIAWALVGILRGVLHVFPLDIALWLLWVGGLILWIVLMVQGFQGNHYKLPFIGDIAEQQAGRPS
jgi:uncharacterized membrane protein